MPVTSDTPSTRRRRVVTPAANTIPGKGVKLWAYGYSTLARLLGMSEGAVRQAVHRKDFDPASLESIVTFLVERARRSPDPT